MSDDQILTSLRHFAGISKLYILHSPNSDRFPFEDFARDLVARLADVKFCEVELRVIDAFEMQSVIDEILRIAESEGQSKIYVNVTGGTNMMAAAAAIAAFSIGANGYYVLDERRIIASGKSPIVELPMPAIRITKGLEGTQLRVLRRIAEQNGKISSADIKSDLKISAQTLSYHIGQLRKKGHISTSRGVRFEERRDIVDSRYLVVEITKAGRLVTNVSY